MKKQVSIYLDEDFIERCKKSAEDLGLKMATLIRNDTEKMQEIRDEMAPEQDRTATQAKTKEEPKTTKYVALSMEEMKEISLAEGQNLWCDRCQKEVNKQSNCYGTMWYCPECKTFTKM